MYDRIREGFGGVAPRARVLGRLALWALVALIFVRGLGAIFESPTPEPDRSASSSGRSVDDATAAFAVRFARSFLADPSKGSLAPFFPPSAPPPAGASSPGGGREVAQAEVSAVEPIDPARSIVTVTCEMVGGGTHNLAVPIVRDPEGRVAAAGVPYPVSGPPVADEGYEKPAPLAGDDAGAIQNLVAKFTATYVGAVDGTELFYLVAPGVTVAPLGGSFKAEAPVKVSVLDETEGQLTVLASTRLTEVATGIKYPVGYRLSLVERDRWYVAGIEGVPR